MLLIINAINRSITIFSLQESTAMAIVGEECGLFPALKDWVQSNKPVRRDASCIYLIIETSITSSSIHQLLVSNHLSVNYIDATTIRN